MGLLNSENEDVTNVTSEPSNPPISPNLTHSMETELIIVIPTSATTPYQYCDTFSHGSKSVAPTSLPSRIALIAL